MGWDIVMYTRFPRREPPAFRFRQLWQAIESLPDVEPLSSFQVTGHLGGERALLDLNDIYAASQPVDAQRVEAALADLADEGTSLSGTWRTLRWDAPGALIVTVYGAQTKAPGPFATPIDLTWDLGDWRRFGMGAGRGGASFARAAEDLRLLVDLGAESIWGLDGDKIMAPEHLYAVFHRDPDGYRKDGGPPLPAVLIAEECLQAAIEVGDDRGAVATPAGPIVYVGSPGTDRLTRFYDALQGAVEYLAAECGDRF